MADWMFILIMIAYFIVGAVINGLMHRYDPVLFDCSSTQVALVVFWWIILIPLYWFCIFCDRCIVWFEKKEK